MEDKTIINEPDVAAEDENVTYHASMLEDTPLEETVEEKPVVKKSKIKELVASDILPKSFKLRTKEHKLGERPSDASSDLVGLVAQYMKCSPHLKRIPYKEIKVKTLPSILSKVHKMKSCGEEVVTFGSARDVLNFVLNYGAVAFCGGDDYKFIIYGYNKENKSVLCASEHKFDLSIEDLEEEMANGANPFAVLKYGEKLV